MQNLRKHVKDVLKRGDTIIEVTLALTVFSLISVLAIQLMDRDVALIQATLESEMARNEIDSQAEALRFIQKSYLSERELAGGEREFEDLWLKLSRDHSTTVSKAGSGLANAPANISQYTSVDCSTYYETDSGTIHSLFKDRAFVINTRKLDPTPANISETVIQSFDGATKNTSTFTEAPLYPRIIYSRGSTSTTDSSFLSEYYPAGTSPSNTTYDKVVRAEGIWVIAAQAETNSSTPGEFVDAPEFYDFHIRTCWFAPGHDRPSTIATTIRLYNPELIEGQVKRNP